MSKRTIIYVGGFILPDQNAAAQRVVAVAKILRDIGYNIVFLNRSSDAESQEWRETSYFGFTCFEQRKKSGRVELLRDLTDIDYIKKIVSRFNDVAAIIAYNFPAVALRKLNSYCKANDIKCIGDVTEWYGSKGRSLIYKIVKGLDTLYRMKIIHKRLDGIIAISDFLEDYYSQYTKTVNIPPLVDKKEKKWECSTDAHSGIRLIYAGSPSSEKERLDLIVNAVIKLNEQYDIRLSVIGITKEQFKVIYSCNEAFLNNVDCVQFLGRIAHTEVIKQVSKSDYSILIRDKNRVNTAGFPTKFVESISCGTAVIANETSCISKYFKNNLNGIIITGSSITEDLEKVIVKKVKPLVQNNLFDYRNYIDKVKAFMESCNV